MPSTTLTLWNRVNSIAGHNYGIVVNKDCKRFYDEGKRHLFATFEMIALECWKDQDMSCFFVTDDSIMQRFKGSWVYETTDKPPEKADTIEELAEKMGLDPKELKKTIDEYVEKYTAGFSAPNPSSRQPVSGNNEKVVLVTGASGSLGGHLTFKLALLAGVKTVVCLNRENRAVAFERQKKAMKDKGVHFPESLLSKLEVLQADTSKPMLGLSEDRAAAMTDTTPLFGALPELDSMAVAGLFTELEDRLGITIEDDEVDGEMLETFGALRRFASDKALI